MKRSSTPDNDSLKARLTVLQAEISRIAKLINKAAEPGASPRISLWQVVRDYLLTVDGKDSPDNIVEALLEKGHELGKYPLRNLKIMVTSRYTRGIFNVKSDPKSGKEMILLVDRETEYKPSVYRRSVK